MYMRCFSRILLEILYVKTFVLGVQCQRVAFHSLLSSEMVFRPVFTILYEVKYSEKLNKFLFYIR